MIWDPISSWSSAKWRRFDPLRCMLPTFYSFLFPPPYPLFIHSSFPISFSACALAYPDSVSVRRRKPGTIQSPFGMRHALYFWRADNLKACLAYGITCGGQSMSKSVFILHRQVWYYVRLIDLGRSEPWNRSEAHV